MVMFLGFTSHLVESRNGDIFVIQGGAGPPVLLLHGFPETHLMWRAVAPLLAADFSVICADLPGYGRSACPPDEQRTRYFKRSMAEALVEVMAALGHDRFSSPQLSQRMHGWPRAFMPARNFELLHPWLNPFACSPALRSRCGRNLLQSGCSGTS
jgi:hypothetical protein